MIKFFLVSRCISNLILPIALELILWILFDNFEVSVPQQYTVSGFKLYGLVVALSQLVNISFVLILLSLQTYIKSSKFKSLGDPKNINSSKFFRKS